MSTRILIMGLPGSGKTTLAEVLHRLLDCPWYNADRVRDQFDDWDFSTEGRLRQARRMRELTDDASGIDFIIADFVAPTHEIRDIYEADFTIWVDTIESGRFEDTNRVFEAPTEYDFRVTTQDAEMWANQIMTHLIT